MTTTDLNALVLKTDGTVYPIVIPKGQFLPTLYKEIDCRTVTCVAVSSGLDIWADDDALATSEPQVNSAASHLAGSPIIGNVVFLGGADKNGDELSLPTEVANRLLTLIALSNSVEQIARRDS